MSDSMYGLELTIKAQNAEIERLRAALASSESWIERWTRHVGSCADRGGLDCTCGRTAILYEARAALRDDEQRGNGNG